MRTYLRGKLTLLFMMFALMLALPAAAWAAVTIDTSVSLGTSAATPSNVQIGSNDFTIKVWGTNGSLGSGTGTVTVGNAYSMSTTGAITQTGTTTVTLPDMNYSQCPATGGPSGCPGNPISVPATLTVTTGTADGTTGVLTITQSVAASGSGINVDQTPAKGNVKVVNPQPTKQDQTITFGALANKTFGDPNFNVSATASSGLPVSFAASGACTISSSTVSITGAGNCDITASQAGDASYNAAPNVVQSFTIAKATQTIDFGALGNKTFGDADFNVNATGGGSGNPVTFAATGNCTISGNTVSITGAGSCTVTASQAGNDNYFAADPVSHTFTINKATQTITFGTLSDKIVGAADFNVNATGGGSGNPVTFTASPADTCTISGNSVHITGVGTCTITASQAGNENYLAAPNVSQSFKVTYNFGGFLQPINWTAHQVLDTNVSTFKGGSTVPVKFQLKDANGNLVQAGSAQWTVPQKGSATTQAVDEGVFTDQATNGTTYKYDSTAQQYIYNWGTKGVAANFYYKIGVKLDDGNTYYTYISLR